MISMTISEMVMESQEIFMERITEKDIVKSVGTLF